MTFLTPWSAIFAAALAIPVLLLLYFLKLRRRYLRIPSTLLWQTAFEDLQVNVPFQKLRWSVLLLLQLLALVAVLLAIAQPVAQADAPAAERVILLIDRSASMSAVEGPALPDGTQPTRLDAARGAAREIVERLMRGSGARQVMIVSFASSARVASGFESRRDLLLDAIDSIGPTDEPGNLSAALRLAEAFAARTDEAADGAVPAPPQVILLSDGGVDPPEKPTGFALGAGQFRFAQVVEAGSVPDNVGIVTFSARRHFDEPSTVLVFVRLANAGPEPVETVLTLRHDDEVLALERLELPAAGDHGARTPGEASITIALDLPGGGVLAVRHGHEDQLAADDTAVLVLPAPRPPRVALVHGGDAPDPFLLEVLQAAEPESLEVMTTPRYDGLDQSEIDGGERYDVIVFDRVSGHRLPAVPTLSIGGGPLGIEVVEPSREGGRRFLSWKRQHPLLRHVALDEIVYAGFGAYRLPAAAETLATGEQGVVMAKVRSRGASHVLVGIDLARSTWPVDVSFTVFVHNVLEQATAALSGQTGVTRRPGEPVTVRREPGASELVITGPQDERVEVPVIASGNDPTTTLPAFRKAGLYEVEGAMPPDDEIAVSVLNDVETDVRRRERLVVNATSIEAGAASAAAPLELWPWMLAAAIALLTLEWLVYCHRTSG